MKLITVAKMIFDRFFWFIDMFLSVLKICIVSIFDSLVGSGSWELAVVSQEEVAGRAR
jgi:hypothetical protein